MLDRRSSQQPAQTQSDLSQTVDALCRAWTPQARQHPKKTPGRKRVSTTRRALLFLLVYSVALAGSRANSQTLLTTVATGSHPAALAINPTTNKLYVANENSNNVTVIDEATDSTATIPAGAYPIAVAVNPATNKIYVANQNSNNVTVIDGVSNSTTVVATGRFPQALAVNSVTNQIFVANRQDNSITAINGSNNMTFTIPVGDYPSAVAVNSLTNKIYIANLGSNTVTVINGATGATTTVAVGAYPTALAVNTLTNKIYVANGTYATGSTGTVTVIDGSTNSTTTVPAGLHPSTVAVNPVTNKIYVTNVDDGTVTVIDGVTNSTATIAVGGSPGPLAVDPVTDKIYVINDLWYGSVTMIDGVTGSTTTVAVGQSPCALAVDPVGNRIYVGQLRSNSVSVIAGAWSPALQFVPATPCRVVDTRAANGPFGGPALSGGTSRDFAVPANLSCGIPSTAAAYSLNLAVVPHGVLGYVTMWPTGEDQPLVATLNSLDGRIKANAAIVPAGASGAIRVFASNTTDVVLDIDGYFLPAPDPSAYAFFPLTPCRVADTRTTNGPLGGPYLYGGQQRDFPVLAATACGIPNNAVAYSLNVAAIPQGGAPSRLSDCVADGAEPASRIDAECADRHRHRKCGDCAGGPRWQDQRLSQPGHRPGDRHQRLFRAAGAWWAFTLFDRALSRTRHPQDLRRIQWRAHRECSGRSLRRLAKRTGLCI